MRAKLGLPLIFVLLVVFGTVSVSLSNRNKADSGQDKKQPDLSHFPMVEYEAVRQSDPNKDARRQTKSKKYNKKHTGRISEASEGSYLIVDWDVGLPAFPVARSVAIVTGEVTDARAYLSEDGTGIYSEFSIQVDEILKNDPLDPVTAGVPLFAEREGGRVRLPSGKIVTARVIHQDMPRPGRRYVFFLMRTDLNGNNAEGFYLLTAYELREGQVFPLDKVSEKHPINQYKGKTVEEFLTELRAFIVDCPTITVACPAARGPIEFTATVSPDSAHLKVNFQWMVSRGKIASGQGTSKITVDAERKGESMGASLEVVGLPAKCLNTASCWVSHF
jgi:hypothetical protein